MFDRICAYRRQVAVFLAAFVVGCGDPIVKIVGPSQNNPPIANAGRDQLVTEGSQVTLNGSGSTDADGDAISHSWSEVSDYGFEISNPDTPTPTFVAPLVSTNTDTLVVLLVDRVSDGEETSSDTVVVSVVNENQAPVADAGPELTVNEGSVVPLDCSASTDPDQDPLECRWEQVEGPVVAFSQGSTSGPSLISPNVGPAGDTLTIELEVFDGIDIDLDTLIISVLNVDQAAVADAGDDITSPEGSTVTLDGSRSSDPDGEEFPYLWRQLAGPAVVLSDSTVVSPSFTLPSVGREGDTLSFELDVLGDTDTVVVTVTNVNQPPVADADVDRDVSERDTVRLNGSGSSDPDGDTLSYAWVLIFGPDATLSDSALANPWFVVPDISANGIIITRKYKLTVSDSLGAIGVDTVVINATNVNQPPDPNAGDDQLVMEGSQVTLNGSGSTDPDNDAISHSWSEASDHGVVITSPTATRITITVPLVSANADTLEVVMVDNVSDGEFTVPDTVVVRVVNVNQPPVADAGANQTVTEGSAVTLNGSATDPDGDVLTAVWRQIAGPTAMLSDNTSFTPTLTAPAVDTTGAVLSFELDVSDGLAQVTDTVEVTVTNYDPCQDSNAPTVTVSFSYIPDVSQAGAGVSLGPIRGYNCSGKTFLEDSLDDEIFSGDGGVSYARDWEVLVNYPDGLTDNKIRLARFLAASGFDRWLECSEFTLNGVALTRQGPVVELEPPNPRNIPPSGYCLFKVDAQGVVHP